MKETIYTCDLCKKGISNYGIGNITDASIVNITITIPDGHEMIDGNMELHYKCYRELLEWMEQYMVRAVATKA